MSKNEKILNFVYILELKRGDSVFKNIQAEHMKIIRFASIGLPLRDEIIKLVQKHMDRQLKEAEREINRQLEMNYKEWDRNNIKEYDIATFGRITRTDIP